jgi:GNAT superfamily N-acetyltransferase
VHLRRAERSDLERLVQWSRDFEHGVHGEPFIERTFEALESRPERGGIFVLEDGEAVGYTILVGFWSNEFRGEALIVDELYVAPEHRGGRGTAALRAIEERARAQGVKLLALEVLPDTPEVHALYQRAGFRSGRTLYQKRLA